ncbi:unnamed protein product, partial [Mycena citricolor]
VIATGRISTARYCLRHNLPMISDALDAIDGIDSIDDIDWILHAPPVPPGSPIL